MRNHFKAALSLLLLAAAILALVSCAQPLPVFKSSDGAKEFPPGITAPDGAKYTPCDISQWYVMEPAAIGITDWTKSTIYCAKADVNKNLVYYKKTDSETVVYYAREGFTLPKLDREGIDSVEWVTDQSQAGKNTNEERSVVNQLMDAINGEKGKMQADVPAVEAAKVYMYSKKAPGLAFRTAIWYWAGKYFIINLAHQSVWMETDLVEKLKARKAS